MDPQTQMEYYNNENAQKSDISIIYCALDYQKKLMLLRPPQYSVLLCWRFHNFIDLVKKNNNDHNKFKKLINLILVVNFFNVYLDFYVVLGTPYIVHYRIYAARDVKTITVWSTIGVV